MNSASADERTIKALRAMTGGVIHVIHRLVDLRDPYTGIHQRRTADLARTMGREMRLDPGVLDGLRMAGLIHDIGKIAVPIEVLTKPTRLNRIEYELMKSHAEAGADILSAIEFPWPIAEIVRQHHERWDGSGYSRGLKGEAILLEARILAVADVVDAMMTHRPYRAGLSREEALREISDGSGIRYDPEVARACLHLFRQKGYEFNISMSRIAVEALTG